MAAYKLDQKANNTQTAGGQEYGFSSTRSNAGYHNSIFNNFGFDSAKIAADTSANAQATGAFPMWAWIAFGLIATVGILFFLRKKKSA